MGTVNKITGSLATAISKVSGTAISGIAKIMDQVISLFTDTKAAAKAPTTGTANAVYITDSDGYYTFDQADLVSVSFWIKPGWTTSLNTNIHLWSSTDVGGAGVNADTFRIFYYENLNRLYVEWRSAQNDKCSNFWLFHSNSGVYANAYAAAGLGTSYWTNTNRGNVGDDDYTLITVVRGSANNGGYFNCKLYWNQTDCGLGFYSAENGKTIGNNVGTPAMGNNDKQMTLGSNSWNFTKAGDTNDTKFNGVSVWNVALSGSDVTEIWNGGTPMNLENHSRAANLVGWWNFEGDGNNSVSGGPAYTINGDSSIEDL
tara:strand:- start:14582 stop:15526 length:945 start_codon:yes stop_codon:yes gene_type:complete